MSAITVSLINQKGGVGKTSTTFHLGGTLAREGRRVLLLDADGQASLTQGIIGPDAAWALPRESTIAALFGDGLIPEPAELVRPTDFENLWLVAGSRHLARHNVPEPERAPLDQQRALAEFLVDVREQFDVILIDCAPTLYLGAWSALVGSDAVLTPLIAEDYSSQGLAAILDFVEAIQKGPNPRLRLLGFLLTMHNARLAIHRAYEATLREMYGELVFEATVPLATDFKESIAARRPIAFHKPKGASSKAIRKLADELLARALCTVQNDQKDNNDDAARRVA